MLIRSTPNQLSVQHKPITALYHPTGNVQPAYQPYTIPASLIHANGNGSGPSCQKSCIAVHLRPGADGAMVVNPNHLMYSWCVSQLIRCPGPVQLFTIAQGLKTKAEALALAKSLFRVFTDSCVPWPESIQLPRLATVMRQYDPLLWCRWGERWTYTQEYAHRVLNHIPDKQLPTYVVCQRMVDSNGVGDWCRCIGKYQGVWGQASWLLDGGETQQQRYRRL